MDLTSPLPLPQAQAPIASLASNGAASAKALRDSKAQKVAEDYESFFITMYLESMFQGVETEGLFGGGQAEKVYRSMLNQEVGKAIANNGGLGIADSVMREIIKMQEGS